MKSDANNADTTDEKSVDEQRARWEQFQFTVLTNGYVNVVNKSHNDDSAHTYSVETRNGSAVSCSCPHYQHRLAGTGDSCKHMIAVEQNPLVLTSATAAGTATVATDGGKVETEHAYDSPKVTIHRKPEGVGGLLYGRCENCGVECVADTDGQISILHTEDCPGDSEPDTVNDNPL